MNIRSTRSLGRALLPLYALLLGLALLLGIPQNTAMAEPSASSADARAAIAIIHTNDIHAHGLAASDSAVGFAGVAGAKKALQKTYGTENVALVDAGDTILGSVVGAVSRGEEIVKLMKASGYDVAVPGNHDFDYGIARLRELDELAKTAGDAEYATPVSSTFAYVASNVTHIESGDALFPGYEIKQLGDVKVAFVGVVRPETPQTEDPSFFEEDGELAWDFHGGDLAKRVQASVDEAKAEGADYVIAVTHLGQGASSTLISQVTDVDAVIDGHSHTLVSGFATNGDGERIPIAQCGTRFQAYGTLVIEPSAEPSPSDITSTVTSASSATREAALPEVAALVEKVEGALEADVKGTTAVDLVVDAKGGETNLGNFVADAYRAAVPGAEVGLVNAGGIETPRTARGGKIVAGSGISLAVLGDINPYGDAICELEMTGSALKSVLAQSSTKAGTKQFLQVSGVRMRGKGAGLSVSVLDGESGAYEPLELDRTYKVATSSYLANGGDGYSQFAEARVAEKSYGYDYEALVSWLTGELGGNIDGRYAGTEERIVLASGGSGNAGNAGGSSGSGGSGGGSSGGSTGGSGGGSGSDISGDVGDIESATPADPAPEDGTTPEPSGSVEIYRLYNTRTSEHLYTSSAHERDQLASGKVWVYESVGWSAPAEGTPVYRVYNSRIDDHLYTDEHEAKTLAEQPEWTMDNGGKPLFYSGGSVELYRLYHYASESHLITRDAHEYDVLPGQGWLQEGVKMHGAA